MFPAITLALPSAVLSPVEQAPCNWHRSRLLTRAFDREGTDGFSPSNESSAGTALPGCFIPDDFGHALGDPLEARLKTALAYRDNQACPAVAKAAVAHKSNSTSDVLANGKIGQPFIESLGVLGY